MTDSEKPNDQNAFLAPAVLLPPNIAYTSLDLTVKGLATIRTLKEHRPPLGATGILPVLIDF